MRYTTYGKTGLRVSRLGFGVMRLPVIETDDGKEQVEFDKSTPLLRAALDAGVNFFDTHHNYHATQSEEAIGYALEGRDRSSVVIQTKNPTWRDLEPGESYRARLEAGLKRTKTDYFDLYLMHSLSWANFEKVGERFFEEANRARDEGLIRHIGMSTHDKPENVIRLIDTGLFECILCQYNLIDLSNEEVIRHAHERGLGVSVMGPVGGGRLSAPSEISAHLPGGSSSGAEAALRFVLSNPDIDVAVSGMSALEHVSENVATAEIDTPLSQEEKRAIRQVIDEKRRLADLYCTGCGYCMPCPNGVNIKRIFEFMNWRRIYGLDGVPREYYSGLVRRKHDAGRCVECGQCEPKCPQKIEIVRQLRESHEALS